MARSKKTQQEEVVLADGAADTVEYRGADYGMDTEFNWSFWHSMNVPAIVEESDDVEAPRENEMDRVNELVEFLQSYSEVPMIDIMASLNIAADSIWPRLKDITAQGYALFITEDQRVLFGMTAMAHLYDKIEAKVVTVEKPGRKSEVLALLQSHTAISIPQMAKTLGITERNISSQLSYLRKDGHLIGTNSRGWKVLEKSE